MGHIKAPRGSFKTKVRPGEHKTNPHQEITYYYAADVEKLLNDPGVVEIKIVEGGIEDSDNPSSLLTSDDEKFLIGVTRKERKKVKEEWAAELVVGVRDGKKKKINRPGARIKKLDNDDIKKDLLLSRTESHEKDKFEPILKRIQANILWHHKKKFAIYSFLNFKENKRSEVVQWLTNLKLTSAYGQMNEENKVDTIRCAYLTYKGYEYLNIPSHLIPESGVSTFKAGPEERTVYTNRRQFKDKRYDTTTHMVLLEAFDDDSVPFEEKINEFKIAVSGFVDLSKSFFETAFTNYKELKITQDWFGFQEGIGNPKFFSSKLDNPEKQFNGPIPGNAPLNIVLTEDPNGVDADCYGSFLIFLKLQQEVQNFEALCQDLGAAIGKSTEEAAELLIGRKKNGEPLVPLKITDPNIKHDNYFDYSNDAEGKSCPFHAHIRKANPRKKGFEESNIVRRSMSYKEVYNNRIDDKIVVERKGMFFMAFMRNIEQQFERLVNYQMYDFDESDPNNAPDPLIMDENYIDRSYFNANGQKESFSKIRKLVTYRAGIYLFAPSLPFFENLD